MTAKRTSYHHGNLRRALLDSGLALLAEKGPDGFTLREVARRAGVSHAAPYHHFADRGALIRGIVAESFELLGSALAEAASDAGADPFERLEAMGLAYVDFALDHPQRYRLMFRTELSRSVDPDLPTEADAAGGGAFATLMAAVQDAADQGLLRDGTDAGGAAVTAWSSVHGLASLILEGAIGILPDQRERARPTSSGSSSTASGDESPRFGTSYFNDHLRAHSRRGRRRLALAAPRSRAHRTRPI
jgi:AcrR family transcriptional regulator